MATANSLDDILNCAVDESAISAIVGSLESQLASPTSKDPAHQTSASSVHHNHVGAASTGAASSVSVSGGVSQTQVGQASTHAIPVTVSKHLSQISDHSPTVNSVNGSKDHTSQSQFVTLNSVVNSAAGLVHSPSPGTPQPLNVSVPAQTTSVGLVNSITTGNSVLPAVSGTVITNVIKTESNPITPKLERSSVGSTNAGSVVYGGVASLVGTSSLVSNVQATTNSGSAIYNLANVAAEQKPILVPGSSVATVATTGPPKPVDVKPPVLVNVVTSQPTIVQQQQQHRPQFVLKSEKNGMSVQPQPGAVRFVTQPQQPVATSTPQLHMIPQQAGVSTALKSGTMTSVTTSVITITRPAAPQTVTVLRAPTSTTPGTQQAAPSQIQFVNVPRVSQVSTANVAPKTLAPRVITQAPIRIAQQPHMLPVRPPGVQIPGAAPATTVLIRNSQGQLVLVQQPSTTQTTVPSSVSTQPYKIQQVKFPGAVQPGGSLTSTVIPSTHVQPGTHHPLAIRPQTVTTIATKAPVVTVPQSVLATVPQQAPVVSGAHVPSSSHVSAAAAHLAANQGIQENVRKCKNFLSTLIKLASNQPSETVRNVKELIQGLVDGKVEPEEFTAKLQVELKSSPQPYLVPFLKKSLPSLRQSLGMNKMHIEGVRPPPEEVVRAAASQVMVSTGVTAAPTLTAATPHPNIPTPVRQLQAQELAKKQAAVIRTSHPGIRGVTPTLPAGMVYPQISSLSRATLGPANQTKNLLKKPAGALLGTQAQVAAIKQAHAAKQAGSKAHHSQASSPAGSAHRDKRKYDSLKEDDDINDVAAMGGVNLSEETKNILATNSELMGGQLRSCTDENFLHSKALAARISCIAQKHGVDNVPQDVINLISHATQERLRNIAEKLAIIAEHRLEIYKTDQRLEVVNEVKPQIKFLEELEKLEKKQHADAEREQLLRAARSRSKHEDPEQLKLKEKARALQQKEAEVVRQKEANVTALAAIGPRKKRKPDTDSQTPESSLSSLSGSSTPKQARPARRKRVCLRDLLFLLEQERETTKSQTLYKAFLK